MKKSNNEYKPIRAMIEKVVEETPDAKTLTLHAEEKINYKPGQFLMLSIPGYGEAPFTFASCPEPSGRFQVSIRRVGALTAAVHNLREKDFVGVRGPYGNTFPLEEIKKKGLLFVAGGCGLAPLRSLIQHVFKYRNDHGRVEVVYGCRAPKDRFYKEEMNGWLENADTKVHLTVDEPDGTWNGTCGVVCVLFPKIKLNPKTTIAFLCGPGAMLKFAIKDILKMGFKEENIYASLERHMKCGIGKCGHCYMKGKYACLDGPNFSYSEMKELGIES